MSGFRDFILKGNVVDLAVAVIIGAAFVGIIDSMTRDIITPLIGLAGNQPDFSSYKIGPIAIGNFVNALIAFLIKALVVYYGIVKPFTVLIRIFRAEKAVTPPVTPEIALLTEIRDLLQREK